MMQIKGLIQKANRIGRFFEAMPERDEGIEGIVNHLRMFWEPRMRTAMLAFLAEHPDGRSGSEQLDPLVLEAIISHRERLEPATDTA